MYSEKTSGALERAALALENRFEEILADYERRLYEAQSLLVIGRVYTREQLRCQTRSVLDYAAARLRGEELSPLQMEDRLYQDIEESRTSGAINPDESLRAVAALFGAALSAISERLSGPEAASPGEISEVAAILQESIMERVARVSLVSYVDYLLRKLRESGSEERRRIGRELHDRVAHSMAVVSQSLELYEALRERSPSQAEAKMALAKETAKEALLSTRDLSLALRRSEAESGLKLTLSNLLQTAVPPDLRSELSMEGDESRVPSHVRDQVFLILREAVRNAVAHARATEIRVRVRITPDRIEAAVEDDGRGFAPERVARDSGQRSMRERASLLGGVCTVSSRRGGGARVEVDVPLRTGR
jgi:signal transduction histidine kinase